MKTKQVKISVMLDHDLNEMIIAERERITRQTGIEPPLTRVASRLIRLGFEAVIEKNSHGT
jgi:hypothetical protein